MIAAPGAGPIPVIDVAPYLAGAPDATARLAEAVERTCNQTGFLVISNHGVPQALIDRAFIAAASFFSLSEPEKLALKIEDRNIGYLPYGGQTMRTSTIETATRPNYSESFYITDPGPSAPDGGKFAGRDVNKWPPGMTGFKTTHIEYFKTMQGLARQFLPAFAQALGLADDYFDDDFEGANCTVRLIQYAPQPEDDANLFGFAPHTDGSFITFLPRSELPGLEVQTKSGDWVRPPDIPGAFVINTGEMLARYSNDRFVPTPHRVINRSGKVRHAMPFFYGPNRNKIIHCAPTCVDEQHPPKYEPMSSAQLNAVKDKTNFPHRRPPSR